ncbi:hypothetical protein GGR57DRAFT_460085 [Xylariaceae sp. FL1272]|nr:hypothetical protein GGR57DRAFT_460085 [Xylariaceae sp. FL1272]
MASTNRAWWVALATTFVTIVFILTTLSLAAVSAQHLFNKTHQSPGTIYNPHHNASERTASEQPQRFPYSFHERHDIESLDPQFDDAWNQAMSTPLGGFLLVAHNESFYRAWGVGMFHSIHCLSMLRASFQSYFGLASGEGHMSHSHGSSKRGFVDLSKVDERQHVEHCLGYIGRALLCNGDDTLEPPIGDLDEQGNVLWSGVSGEGVQHSCRDSSLAWQTVAESEENPVHPFKWAPGDTIQSVFRRS